MQRLNLSMDRFKKKPTSKAEFSYQALAEEIAAKYQVPWKRFIWLLWRVPEDRVRYALKECEKSGYGIEKFIAIALNKK